jgi:methyl-accepting chemotaxis protein
MHCASAADELRKEEAMNIEENFALVRQDIRSLAVTVERVESHVQMLAEALTMTRESLERKIDEVDARLSARISVLEDVLRTLVIDVRQNSEDIRTLVIDVRKNSEDIRKNSEDIRKNSEDIRKNSEDIRKNSEDIELLRAEVGGMRAQLARREKLDELETRVTTVEARLGITRE